MVDECVPQVSDDKFDVTYRSLKWGRGYEMSVLPGCFVADGVRWRTEITPPDKSVPSRPKICPQGRSRITAEPACVEEPRPLLENHR